jgi:membrane-bound serine protease (ClpP class)
MPRLLLLLCLLLAAAAAARADTPPPAPEEAASPAVPAAPPADPALPEFKAEKVHVVVVPVRDQISDPVLFVLRRGLKQATENKVSTVVLDMKTPGGSAQTALEMMEVLGRFQGTTMTYVNDEAISAGAFIAAATDEIWFKPRGVIGAAAAVTAQGAEIPETMRLKLNSFLRAKVRAASEGKGYRGDVISAMIDKDFELKIGDTVIKKPGELLSLTAEEAMATHGEPPQPLLAAGLGESLTDVLDTRYGKGNYVVTHLEVTWSERLAQYLTNLSPLLLGLGMLALVIEFKTPGFGIFGITGGILLGLVFLSSYIAGLSGHEPILVFGLGVVLVAVEIFFVPGIAILAVSGVVLMLGSLVWAMADLWPNEPITFSGGVFIEPLTNVALGLAVAVAVGLALVRFLPRGWIWDKIILDTALTGTAQTAGVPSEAPELRPSVLGAKGITVSALRPFGTVDIDGVRYDARLTVGTAGPGEPVVVTGRTDFGLVVERLTS